LASGPDGFFWWILCVNILEDRLALEYAPRGLIGVFTPQANTTVEPEMQILLPPGFAFINARLTSPKNTIEDRLIDYYDTLESSLDQFANAPIQAIAVGCTGASYLVGRAREAELIERWTDRAGVPAITTGVAVVDALNAIGAKRIGFVSCYPPSLTEASSAYWASHGFEIGEIAGSFNDDDEFHPIYSLRAANASEALAELRGHQHDAIVMLGTGMPTLQPIADVVGLDGPPVLSCMLCLAWRCVHLIEGQKSASQSVIEWSRGMDWTGRLAARTATL